MLVGGEGMAADWTSGLFALGGVLVGGAVPPLIQMCLDRRVQEKQAKHFAMHLAGQLVEHAWRCAEIVSDHNSHDNGRSPMGRPASNIPEFCLPTSSKEWKFLNLDTISILLEVPLMIADAKSYVAFEADVNGPQICGRRSGGRSGNTWI